eukprot:CAMPEP_0195102020 /NCGR_PEP_ID=MMETSP0448-20130528/65656_1 /TAXON_ID=66468 /ORGANISM="Heterocapsa triquestra, Strain CCMP 448" /LENGTH=43 /DNA_ID= /DNA_START= /DNA_END= /DNA_ORIENTATION=
MTMSTYCHGNRVLDGGNLSGGTLRDFSSAPISGTAQEEALGPM